MADRIFPSAEKDSLGSAKQINTIDWDAFAKSFRTAEEAEDASASKPFEDWETLQQRAAARHKETIAFQQKMRTDPRVLKAANNDPKQVARIIHEMTKLRNGRNTFNPGDFIRYHDTVNSAPFGSLKAGPMTENWYDLSDRTNRRPYIIR